MSKASGLNLSDGDQVPSELQQVVATGDEDELMSILEQKSYTPEQISAALYLAVEQKKWSLLSVFLKNGANFYYEQSGRNIFDLVTAIEIPLLYAKIRNAGSAVLCLMPPEGSRQLPLLLQAIQHKTYYVDTILSALQEQKKASPELLNAALHLAVQLQQWPVVCKLLLSGSQLFAKNADGKTIFAVAREASCLPELLQQIDNAWFQVRKQLPPMVESKPVQQLLNLADTHRVSGLVDHILQKEEYDKKADATTLFTMVEDNKWCVVSHLIKYGIVSLYSEANGQTLFDIVSPSDMAFVQQEVIKVQLWQEVIAYATAQKLLTTSKEILTSCLNSAADLYIAAPENKAKWSSAKQRAAAMFRSIGNMTSKEPASGKERAEQFKLDLKAQDPFVMLQDKEQKYFKDGSNDRLSFCGFIARELAKHFHPKKIGMGEEIFDYRLFIQQVVSFTVKKQQQSQDKAQGLESKSKGGPQQNGHVVSKEEGAGMGLMSSASYAVRAVGNPPSTSRNGKASDPSHLAVAPGGSIELFELG